MTDPQPSNPPVLGRYQVLSELAKSPIGGLMLALDVPEHRVVALRSVPVEHKISSMDNLLLLEAGKWVKGLVDPAIMQPLESGAQEGVLHAGYEYCISEPLRGVMRLASFKGEPMPVSVALRIAHDVVLGARAIEAWGASPALGETLCGGLLPDSILVGQDGKTRLCDAGIAAVLRRTPEYGQQAEVLGYAAPEQLDGNGTADSRSDVFTLGVLLWEMLANRRLFAAAQLGDIMDKVRSMPVPVLDSSQRAATDTVPESISAVILRALQREPKERYAGTTALLQALETHAARLMASPARVGAYVTGLVGNIFETRSRAMERALAPVGDSEQKGYPPVLLRSVPNDEKSHDPRSRAATTLPRKSSPKASAPIPPPPPKNRTTPTPKQRGSRPSVHIAPVTPLPVAPRASMQSSPPIIAALVDDAIAQGEREAKAAGHIHPTLPPPSKPLEAVIPGLPNTLELPGAELFATPGLPLVTRKPSSVQVQPAPVGSTTAEQEPERAAVVGSQATPGSAQPSELGDLAELARLEPDPAESRARGGLTQAVKRPKIWVAVLSLLLIAFMFGLAIRRCTHPIEAPPAGASAAASVDALTSATGASAPAAAGGREPTSANAREPMPLGSAAATAAAPVSDQLADAGARQAGDAGVVRKPAVRAPHVSQRPRKRTAAPRYNSKVTRSRGKTTR